MFNRHVIDSDTFQELQRSLKDMESKAKALRECERQLGLPDLRKEQLDALLRRFWHPIYESRNRQEKWQKIVIPNDYPLAGLRGMTAPAAQARLNAEIQSATAKCPALEKQRAELEQELADLAVHVRKLMRDVDNQLVSGWRVVFRQYWWVTFILIFGIILGWMLLADPVTGLPLVILSALGGFLWIFRTPIISRWNALPSLMGDSEEIGDEDGSTGRSWLVTGAYLSLATIVILVASLGIWHATESTNAQVQSVGNASATVNEPATPPSTETDEAEPDREDWVVVPVTVESGDESASHDAQDDASDVSAEEDAAGIEKQQTDVPARSKTTQNPSVQTKKPATTQTKQECSRRAKLAGICGHPAFPGKW